MCVSGVSCEKSHTLKKKGVNGTMIPKSLTALRFHDSKHLLETNNYETLWKGTTDSKSAGPVEEDN